MVAEQPPLPEQQPGILPDLPPAGLIQGEAQQFIADYLRRYGPLRAGFRLNEQTENRQVPGPSMPGYIHLALSQMAGHPALPYSGNVAALVRDLIYIGLGAYAQILSQYNADDPNHTFTTHIIRREETFRRNQVRTLMDSVSAYSIIAILPEIVLATQTEDAIGTFDAIQQLFYHLDQVPSDFWRRQMLGIVAVIPEITEAVKQLQTHDDYRYSDEVQSWAHRLSDIAERRPAEENE